MVPKLFSSTETQFKNEGIGRLVDARKCEVTEERNGQYELVLEYPTNGALIDQLIAGNYIWATHDSSQKPQPFQIYQTSEPLNGFVEVRAWHISYALNAIILKPFTATSCADAISKIASKSINTNPFSFWTDKSVSSAFALTVPKSVRAVLGGSEGSLLDVYGKGEYEFDKFNVKLHVNRGADRGVQIRYGKNLLSLDRQLDASNVYNAVVPYWTDGETTVSSDTLVVKTGQTAGRAVSLDLSEYWDEAPTTTQLTDKAQTIIDASDNYQLKENLKIDFVFLWQTEEYKDVANLQRVNLCDTVHIIYTKRNINATAKVIKVVYDTLRERYLEMELGEPRTSLYQQIQQDTVQTVVPMIPSRPAIQSAIDHATELISGGFGGYIKYKYLVDGTPSEMLIMDAATEATATNIIRLNQNGIGFSTDGGTTYANAWTIDGHLNADFITTGKIEDATGLNFWNLVSGILHTEKGTIGNFTLENGKLTAGDDSSELTAYCEISDSQLIYHAAGDQARIRITAGSVIFEAMHNGSWVPYGKIDTRYSDVGGVDYPSFAFSLYDPVNDDFVPYDYLGSKQTQSGEAPAGTTSNYHNRLQSTFVGGQLGAVTAQLYNPLDIESGGTGQDTAAGLKASRLTDIVAGATEYYDTSSNTSTSGTETTKVWTASGAGIVIASVSVETDSTSNYGNTEASISKNSTRYAYDLNRFGSANTAHFGAHASAAFVVQAGDIITLGGYSSKNGTKTYYYNAVAIGCTLS